MSSDADNPVDHVVFDLGGVVLTGQSRLGDMARIIGAPADIDPDEFRNAYNAPRREYDRTSDTRAYWSAIAAAVGAPQPDDGTVAELTDLDTEGWLGTDPATVALIEEVHDAGVALAVLSNAPASMGSAIRRQPWGRFFQHYVISGEIGLIKPDLAIYRALLDELGAAAERVFFTDDRQENIDGARAVGIRAVPFTGAGDLRAAMRRAGVPVAQAERDRLRQN